MDKISNREITKIAREVNKFVLKTLKKEGIGTSDFDIIHVVRKHNGITQKEISDILGIDKGQLVRSINRLIKRGYILKKVNPKDKRSSLIYPTLKAEEIKISKVEVENLYYDYLFSFLTEEEKESLLILIHKIYLVSKYESKNNFHNIYKTLNK